jgi:VanZ family protein
VTSAATIPPIEACQAAKPSFTRRHYAFLAAGFLAFVIYGSLVPFHYRPMAREEALATYQRALIFQGFSSRSDLLANILLFIPLSYLLLAAISVDRPAWVSWTMVLPILLFCTGLSAAIEFTQIFFPPRCPDINDIIGESIGAILGAALWLGFGRTITGWCRQVWSAHLRPGFASLLLPGYLVFLMLYNLLPLDLTLSPTEIVHKYRHGRIQIIPYAIPPVDRYEWVEKHCWTLALFLPVGMLWAGRSRETANRGDGETGTESEDRRSRIENRTTFCSPSNLDSPSPILGLGPSKRAFGQRWFGVLALGFLLAGLITFLKIFVVSRYVETGDIITGTLAIFLGWLCCSPSPLGESETGNGRDGETGTEGQRIADSPVRRFAGSWFLAAACLGLVIFVNWHPFNFSTDIGTALDRLRNLSWLPFADYYQGSYINFLNQTVRKTLLFVPIGLLLASLGTSKNGGFYVFCMVLALAVALILEIGQAFLPSRYPSVTDVFLETSGAAVGLVLARHGLGTTQRRFAHDGNCNLE